MPATAGGTARGSCWHVAAPEIDKEAFAAEHKTQPEMLLLELHSKIMDRITGKCGCSGQQQLQNKRLTKSA